MKDHSSTPPKFSRYEKFLIALLSFLQFTIILDFMIMSPLGALLMPALHITPAQFGVVVSVYAFSAGTSGLLAAGFADRFDRKKLLLFFYTGFVLGTLMCGVVTTYPLLVAARLITGVFGGVIGSIVFAIITDLFPMEKRGRVMGFVQAAFAGSQILGLPAGIYFANLWGWHAPFIMIVAVSVLAGLAILKYLQPIDAHLKLQKSDGAFRHLVNTVVKPRHLWAFSATGLLTIGGFMLMPFGSAFTVNNLGIHVDQLPLIYLVSGLFSIVMGPLVGRMCDRFGSLPVFVFGTFMSIVMVTIYTHMGVSPLWLVMLVNVVMFVGVFSRMVPSQTLTSAIPDAANRGAFMSVNSSLQQFAGGLASVVAGLIVTVAADGHLEHMEKIGYAVSVSSLVTLFFMWRIYKLIAKTPGPSPAPEAMAGGH